MISWEILLFTRSLSLAAEEWLTVKLSRLQLRGFWIPEIIVACFPVLKLNMVASKTVRARRSGGTNTLLSPVFLVTFFLCL